ncbi:MAG: NUDIX hydrolase [Opitutaceae bacterium]
MRRAILLDLLLRYTPIDTADAVCRARFASFVSSHPDCFERSHEIGHVTGSAWIMDVSGRCVLLTHHRKLEIWVQPGGHADGDADIAAVSLREAAEETGLTNLVRVDESIFDLDIHPIPAREGTPAHDHFDVRFAYRAAGGRAFIVSEESHDLAWAPLEELETWTREPSMLRMREKWRRLDGVTPF